MGVEGTAGVKCTADEWLAQHMLIMSWSCTRITRLSSEVKLP